MFNFNKNSDLGNANVNYYTILGIEKTASREEIRKAYRKLSLNFHPDRNAGDLNKSERYKNCYQHLVQYGQISLKFTWFY